MSLEGQKQNLGGAGKPEKSAPAPKESPVKPPKDLSRSDLRQYFTKPNVELQKRSGLESEMRGGLEKKLFGSESDKYGSLIKEGEITQRINELRREKQFREDKKDWQGAHQLKKDIETLEVAKKDLFKKPI